MATMSATMKQFTKGLKTSLEPIETSVANIEHSLVVSAQEKSREDEVEGKRAETKKLDEEKKQTSWLKKIWGESVKSKKESSGIWAALLAMLRKFLLVAGAALAALLLTPKDILAGVFDALGKTSDMLGRSFFKNIGKILPGAGAQDSHVKAFQRNKPSFTRNLVNQAKELVKDVNKKVVKLGNKIKAVLKTPVAEIPDPVEVDEEQKKQKKTTGKPVKKTPMRPGIKVEKKELIKTGKTRKNIPGKLNISEAVKIDKQRRQNRADFKKWMPKAARVARASSVAFAAAGPYAAACTAIFLTAIEAWAETEEGKEQLAIWQVEADEIGKYLIMKTGAARSFTKNYDKEQEKEFEKNLRRKIAFENADAHKRMVLGGHIQPRDVPIPLSTAIKKHPEIKNYLEKQKKKGLSLSLQRVPDNMMKFQTYGDLGNNVVWDSRITSADPKNLTADTTSKLSILARLLGGLNITSGRRSKAEQAKAMVEQKTFVMSKKWIKKANITTAEMNSPAKSQAREDMVKRLQELGYSSWHQHGNAIDFSYPAGYGKNKRWPELRDKIDSVFPGAKDRMIAEDDHIHLRFNDKNDPMESNRRMQNLISENNGLKLPSGLVGATTVNQINAPTHIKGGEKKTVLTGSNHAQHWSMWNDLTNIFR